MAKWFKKNKKDTLTNEIKEGILEEDNKGESESSTSEPNIGFFDKLKIGLSKTKNDLSNKIDGILNIHKKVDEDLFDDLEDILVTADIGVNTTIELMNNVRNRVKVEKIINPEEIKLVLKEEIKAIMEKSIGNSELNLDPHPAIILVVGVNGVGKTTTIGKLAYNLTKANKKVLIAAGDTYRAAAIEQLEEWSKRSNTDFIAHKEGSDPSAVIYDGIHAAKARKSDILICDTAGRLHNKANLMNELNKIVRIIDREYPEASKEVLLVLDATTGQNAINQAKVFKEAANITGVALTKLDGTAKGGVVIGLQAELGLSVKLIGVGEGVEDLQPFDLDNFINVIFD